MDCCVALLPCANASRLSQAMTRMEQARTHFADALREDRYLALGGRQSR
jgi:hypothetical protein